MREPGHIKRAARIDTRIETFLTEYREKPDGGCSLVLNLTWEIAGLQQMKAANEQVMKRK